MSYNAKNYTEQGGEKTVIGGTLEILDGATVTGITTATIVNNLTSTDTDKALSAAQGKALKDLADAKVATSSIVNDLITGGATVPLSAEQGKTLAARQAENIAPLASDANAAAIVTAVNTIIASMKTAGTMVADWTVTYTLTDATATSQPAVIPNATELSAVITAAEEHTLPETITVKIGGVTKTVSTDYTWTQETGTVVIPAAKVVGNVEIIVASVDA